jgi:Zn-dependent M28 family amino/carboxypeptidase
MKANPMRPFKTLMLATVSVLSVSLIAAAPGFAKTKAKPAAAQSAPALSVDEQAAKLRDAALKSNVAYGWLGQLTTRFGARPAGSDSEKRAAAWAADSLTSMGFENVRIETFPLELWQRGVETAQIVSPFPQKLVVTALGGSQATPPEGIEAEAVMFETYQGFLDSAADVTGKIVVILQPTARTQTGIGYGVNSGTLRRNGPLEAKKRGAVGFLMRSLGTESHRFAHTGATRFQDAEGIASLAMSTPDAENLERMLALQSKGEAGPLRIKIVSTPKFLGHGSSQNVIGEIKGSEHPEEVVTIGGHMDSWDLGTGAIDDGAGMAITLAAAKAIIDQGIKPKRTVRVVLYGSEEVSQPDNKGLSGGQAYADRYVNGQNKHIATAESDFGADVVYAAILPTASDTGFHKRLGKILYPLGIFIDPAVATGGGPDTGPAQQAGVAVFDLQQNGIDYFDTHHTADDVFERIEPAKLDQNVAAWAATVWMMTNTDVTFSMPSK